MDEPEELVEVEVAEDDQEKWDAETIVSKSIIFKI
jgi:hypothetical protein